MEQLRPEPRPRGMDSAWKGPSQLRFSEHLLHARPWAESCPGIVSLSSSRQSCEVGAIDNPILQTEKWRLRDEVMPFTHIIYGVPTLHRDWVDKTSDNQNDFIITGGESCKEKVRSA